MTFHVYHRFGESETNPPLESLDELYEELQIENREHLDVSLQHESEWCLAAFPGGLLVWENLEQGNPRHMKSVPREKVLTLWRLLAEGEIDAINSEPWQDGYG